MLTANADSNCMNNLKELEWLVDNWVSSGNESVMYEEWVKVNDSLFEGCSKTVKNGEVIFKEKLKIVCENGNIYYVADVSHNPEPVWFKLTSNESQKAVFENPEHDFPRKITYIIEDGNLHAFIEGPGKSGEWKKADFYFYKSR